VIINASQRIAYCCKSPLSREVSFFCLALCCTISRSRWCQSGVNIERSEVALSSPPLHLQGRYARYEEVRVRRALRPVLTHSCKVVPKTFLHCRLTTKPQLKLRAASGNAPRGVGGYSKASSEGRLTQRRSWPGRGRQGCGCRRTDLQGSASALPCRYIPDLRLLISFGGTTLRAAPLLRGVATLSRRHTARQVGGLHPAAEKQPQDERQQVDMGSGKAYLEVIFIPAFAPKLGAAVAPCVRQAAPGRPVVRSSFRRFDRIEGPFDRFVEVFTRSSTLKFNRDHS
jgi:hypothetical protein